jgi:hypothetical protein
MTIAILSKIDKNHKEVIYPGYQFAQFLTQWSLA